MKNPIFALCLLAAACGTATPTATETPSPETVTTPAETVPTDLALVAEYLFGEFDNAGQVEAGFEPLVERHVCRIPGRVGDPSVHWFYVEQVEVLSNGDRDAYYTRINEIREVGGQPVTRIYRFAADHPLASDAFSFNGPIDGCAEPEILEAIVDADLEYREGCDVTFARQGDAFRATTAANTCEIPGGFINTDSIVTADGLDSTDNFYDPTTMQEQPLSTFEFRRVAP